MTRRPFIARKEPGIAGIVAALILFVMLFTVGTGYFLYVNTTNQITSQANVNRSNQNLNQQNENLQIAPAVDSSGDLTFYASNSGSSTVNLTAIFITDVKGNILNANHQISGGMTVNSLTSIGPEDTGFPYYPTNYVPVTLKVVTEQGDIFSGQYIPPTVTTYLSATSVGVGSSAFDIATVTGGYKITGTVSYSYFNSIDCKSPPTQVGSPQQVVNGVVPPSAPVTFSIIGDYGWQATYNGDSNNPPAVGDCEPLHVEATTSLKTALGNPSIGVGGTVTDTATLAGATSSATGTITFWLSIVNSCPATGATIFSTVPVSGNGEYPSSPTQMLSTPGTYYVYAQYSGDANNFATTSPCEPLTVGLAVTTSLSASTITAGGSVTDQATLHYATDTASGTISYYYFLGSSCGESQNLVSSNSFTNGNVPRSGAQQFKVNGSYSWEAIYSGDANNQGPVTSPCEPLNVLPVVGGGSGGTLGLVSESFKFYFTNCNSVGNSGSCPPGLGDGVNAGGYYGYGLSFNPLPSCSGFLGCALGTPPTAQPDIFQIKVTNTDPIRSITLSPESFLLIEGQCTSQSEFFNLCKIFSGSFTQSYWIIDSITGSGGDGALPVAYVNPVIIPPGQEETLFFYCTTGPCTTPLSTPSPVNAPPPGDSLVVSLGLYGLYSDGTPFGQTIPYVSSYVSPVYIETVSPGQVAGALQITSAPKSVITLTATNFPAPPQHVDVYWANQNGTVSKVTDPTGPNCSGSSTTCTVSFIVPNDAQSGQSYGIYLTSDGVNNAYATVLIPGGSSTAISCISGSIPVGSSTQCTATVTGSTPTGTITWSQAGGTGSVTFTPTTCLLSSGSCTVTVKGTGAGMPLIQASYDGDSNNSPSSGTTALSVTASLTMSPSFGPSGTLVTVTGAGFAPSSTVAITFSGSLLTINPAPIVNSAGAFSAMFSVPSASPGGQLVVATDSSSDSASATFTVTTVTLALTPNNGPPGTSVTLSGSGYAPSTLYSYCFQSSAVDCPSGTGTTFTSSAAGAIPTGTTIVTPSSANTFVDVSQGSAGGNFIISAAFAPTTSSLTVAPTSGPPTTKITLTGSGYASSTTYSDCLSTSSATVSCIAGSSSSFTSSGTGTIPAVTQVTVPSGTAARADFVIVYSGSSVVNSAGFTVTTPSILLSPSQGPVGTSVIVTGSGFSVGTAIGSVSIAGGTIATQTCTSQTTSATGTFNCTFTVPGVSSGAHTVTISGSDVGTVSGDAAAATFTLTIPAITLSPSQGPVGTSVIVTGSGFSVGTAIGSVSIAGGTIATQTCTSQTTSATGTFNCTFTVPSLANGPHSVTVSGSDIGTVLADSATATYTVPAPKGFDCSASGGSTSNGGVTTGPMTCQSGDLIVVLVTEDFSHTVTGITDSKGVLPAFSQWTERPGLSSNPNNLLIDEWYVFAPAAMSSDTIRVTFSGSSNHNYVAVAIGIAGASTSTPFDTHAGLPKVASCSSGCNTTPTVSGITTSNANDIIIGFEGQISGSAETSATGYSLIPPQVAGSNALWGTAEYKSVSATQNGISVAFGQSAGSSTSQWIMLADVVDPAPQANGPANALSLAGAQHGVELINPGAGNQASNRQIELGNLATVLLGFAISSQHNQEGRPRVPSLPVRRNSRDSRRKVA